jgi:tRNA uridine 5-carboxymethylaminomethyl modification enzyme
VVLTNGTFKRIDSYWRKAIWGGEQAGESAAYGITEDLIKEGFEAGRMKTGTPRVDGRSLDYSKMNEEKGDARPDKFSYSDVTSPLVHQRSCHMTYTSLNVHDILRKVLIVRQCLMVESKVSKVLSVY